MNKMLPSPFKDQKSANAIRHQLSDLSRKIDADQSSLLHKSEDQRAIQTKGT